METFTAIRYEVLIGGAWVDLSADVRHDPPPRCSRGIQSNDPVNFRVSDVGRLEFSLDNSALNSVGLQGRYSPGHANALSGWTASLPIRLIFEYDTWRVVKWYGQIEPDGITVHLGQYGPRRVDVRCIDYMGIVSKHKLNLLTPRFNLTTVQAVDYLLGHMPRLPLRVERSADAITIPVVFDTSGTETTVISEFQKIALVLSDLIFLKGGNEGETLSTIISITQKQLPVATSRATDLELLETGDLLLLEDGVSFQLLDTTEAAAVNNGHMLPGTEVSYGRDLRNFVTVITNPRRVDPDATTVLWTLETATDFEAAESKTFRVAYRDPVSGASRVNCYEGTAPVASTDFFAFANEDGTGSDLTSSMSMTVTFGAAEAEITITNTGGTTFWTGGEDITCQIRGKGVYTYDTVRYVERNAASIATHGEQVLTVDYKYSTSIEPGTAGLVNTSLTYQFENVALCANRSPYEMEFFLFMEPRDRFKLTDTMTGLTDYDIYLQWYEFEIRDGGTVFYNILTKR